MLYASHGLLDEYELGLDRANAADLDGLRGPELQRLVVQNERCKAKQAALDSKLMRAYDASGEWALEELEFAADWAEAKQRLGREPEKWELRRTDAQRRAAAMVLMARRSATSRGGKGKIVVSVFSGPDWFRKMAELDNGTVIRPGQLAPWLDDVSFETFLHDGEFRDVTVSALRTFRGAQARFAMGRDGECVETYCDEPVIRTQGDHEIPHSKGGPTATWNESRRCGGHNRRKGNKEPTERDRGP